MSFFDGIVNATRTAFGIEQPASGSQARDGAHASGPARSEQLAAETPTSFDRPPAGAPDGITRHLASAISGAGSAPSRPTLAERIASAAATAAAPVPLRSAGSGVANLPPHLRASRDEAPPATAAEDASVAANASVTAGGSATSATTATPATTRTGTAARAYVYDGDGSRPLGTADTLSGTDAASAAARNVQHGIDYYARTFGRDGLDDAGAGVNVIANDRSTDEHGRERFAGDGGYYATPRADGSISEAIHFGMGKQYQAAKGVVRQREMAYADDLAVHELTHGIIRKETGHLGGDANEAGATNEAIADVMSAAATRDWRIGEAMYTADSDYRSMRNIADPDDPTAIHGLWTDMDTIREKQRAGEEVEEHWASGVLSTAAYRMQQRFGGEAGWQVVERVFYDTIDKGRLGDMSFTDVAAGLRSSAAAAYGHGSSAHRVVDEELRRAGL